MKRTTIILLAVLLGAHLQAQLLYRISGNGLKQPSYIVGTYHLAPGSFVDSIPGLRDAVASVQQVYGELDIREAFSSEGMAQIQQAQMLPEGVSLTSLLSSDQQERLNALLREVMGVDLSNPALAAQLDKVSPMALSTTITVMLCMKKTPGYNPASVIDSHIQELAMKAGKDVGGFETADFQCKVLFASSLEEQVAALMCMVDNFQDVNDATDFLTSAYFSQDLSQIEELLKEEDEGPCASKPEENDRLIYDRNANWVKAMPAIMKEKSTFFAVGAAHLVGERGVLHLLREQGYTVEGVRK